MRTPPAGLIIGALSWALVLAAPVWTAGVRAQATDPNAILSDPAFANTYRAQYGYLTSTSLAVLTEELRGVLEDVASAGSRVGSTSSGHRVRSFERVFLRRVQDALCPRAGTARQSEPIQSIVVRGSAAAGSESGLTLAMSEMGRLSAIAVRIVERSDRAQLCRSTSLSELVR